MGKDKKIERKTWLIVYGRGLYCWVTGETIAIGEGISESLSKGPRSVIVDESTEVMVDGYISLVRRIDSETYDEIIYNKKK